MTAYIGEESVVFIESKHAWIEAETFVHLEDMAVQLLCLNRCKQ